MTDSDKTRPIHPDQTQTSAGETPFGSRDLPERVGRYRPLRIIGQGGMGIVYEAEQEEPRRRVALKVIRSSMVTPSLERRFAHESVFLGRLSHPGIAQIYESGTAETAEGPLPFIAMELVEGVPLDRWLRTQEPDLRTRVEMMIHICDAVQHAHQRGIIHRDLKPGNVLVDGRGRPRVLDFGVARPHEADLETSLVTTHGELVGTLFYMSPEQLEGDPGAIDTRSDIYALGMMLYEMLAGRRPLDLNGRPLSEVIRMVKEEEPPRLATIGKALAGDLDLITATALAKDPAQRYASANGLAKDLQRYLDDEPISARPPSTIYQLKKFARRHRPLVLGLSGVAAALVLGVAISSWQAVRATRAEHLATARLAQARTTTEFLQDMLAAVNPEEAQGREVTVAEVLDRAAEDLGRGGLADQPEVEMALQQTLGLTYRSLDRLEDSRHHLERGLALADSLYPAGSLEAGQLAVDLAYTQRDLGNTERTRDLVRSRLPSIPPRSPLRVEALGALSDVAYTEGRWQDADSLQNLAVQMAMEISGPDSLKVAQALLSWAFLAEQTESLEAARNRVDRAAAIYRAHYGDDDVRLVSLLSRQGDIARAAGVFQESLAYLEEALAIAEARFPPGHTRQADVLSRMGQTYMARGDYDDAVRVYSRALEIRREVLGPVHRDIALTLAGLGLARASTGDLAGGEERSHEALDMRREIFGPDHPAVAASLHDLGLLARAAGRAAEAESLFSAATTAIEDLPEADMGMLIGSAHYTAMAIQDQGEHERAEPFFRRAVELAREAHGEVHPLVARGMSNLATNLFRQGRKEDAAEVQSRALALQRELGSQSTTLLLAIGNTAYLLDDAGLHAEADSLHQEYIALATEIHGRENSQPSEARARYAGSLIARDMWEPAEAQLDSVQSWREAHLPEGDYRRRTLDVYRAQITAGRGDPEEARRTLTELEGYLEGAQDVEPRRRARIQQQINAAREKIDAALAER